MKDADGCRVIHRVPQVSNCSIDVFTLIEEAESFAVSDACDYVEGVALEPVAHVKGLARTSKLVQTLVEDVCASIHERLEV